MGCAFDEVTVRGDAFLPECLEEKVCLARGDDEILRAMHEKHRSAVLSDVSHGISRLGSSRIGQDAAVTSAKDRRAVHPEASVAPADLWASFTASE